jgi:asparaginyl-tRNA synthetase
MIEPEVAYCELDGDMALAEDFIEYVVQRVIRTRRTELLSLERDLNKLENVKKPFPRISYGEAIELLQKKGVEISWGADFGGDEETLISESFDRPVIIHRYPVENKAFYMKADPTILKSPVHGLLGPEGMEKSWRRTT